MSEFVDYLLEVFEPFGPVRARRMFGGHGLYHRDVMFALVADDRLYLKCDATTVEQFRARELEPFQYLKAGKWVQLSYYAAPEEIFDDPETAVHWARLACDAALRARSKSRPKSSQN